MTPTPQINPADALKALDEAISTITMNRASHVNAQQCVRVLETIILEHGAQVLKIAALQDEIEEKTAQIAGLKEQLRMALENAEGAAPASESSEC